MEFNPLPQTHNWTFRQVAWATLVLVFVVFGFWLLYRFYMVVFTLFIAILIGTVIRPVVNWLYRRGFSRMTGVILVYLLVLALLIGFILLLFPLLIDQGITIAASVPGYYQDLQTRIASSPNQWIVGLSKSLPAQLPGLEPVQQTGLEMLASADQAWNSFALLSKGLFIALATLLLAFYWTLEGPRTIQALLPLLPRDQRQGMYELISAMESKVGYFIAGQAILCLIVGIMALAAYLLIGLPNALVLALIAGLFEAVPMIGPLLGAIPAGLIGLAIAPSKLLWVIVASTIIQQVENNLLVPRVMKKAVGVNPFVSLLSIFAFSSLFGIAGALMAIPTAAIIQLILNRYVFDPGTMESEVSSGRDYASRLRYEAQDLAQDLRKQARIKKGGSDLGVEQINQVMDEIEAITTDLDALLANVPAAGGGR